MKKLFYLLTLLTIISNNILAKNFTSYVQNKNDNWELKIVNYYSNGIAAVVPSNIFVYFSEKDSINFFNEILHHSRLSNIEDSVFIASHKNNNIKKGYSIIAVEYWVKPLRKITSNDTFRIEIKHPANSTKKNMSGDIEIDEDYYPISVVTDVTKNFYYQNIIKQKKENGFYCLGKYYTPLNTSLSMDFYSSDTSLAHLVASHSNFERKAVSFRGVYPSKYEYIKQLYQHVCSNDSLLVTELDSLPQFSWKNSTYKLEIDSPICFRKLITDTINGTVNYSVKKSYLELPKEMISDTKNNSFIFLISKLNKDAILQYKLVPWFTYEDSSIAWIDCPYKQNYLELKNIPIGKYNLYVKNKASNEISKSYTITILPHWYQTNVFKWVVCNLLFVLLGWFAFRKYKNNKIQALQKQKSEIDIQLKSVRSHLNPHFIFNALSSIQSLISSADYQKANEYLIEFSKLLRKPLNQQNIATWNLQDEIEMLKTYIKLEQLRTHFESVFTIDKSITTHTIPFPAMLLQPIVENAIKHGFDKQQTKHLLITINKINADLKIIIEDNGTNFLQQHFSNGNGILLCNEYVDLINKQYVHSHVAMIFDKQSSTTKCIFTFKNWIDE